MMTQAEIAATALTFMDQNPKFAQTEENVRAIGQYMIKRKIEPTLAGFNAAWKEMREPEEPEASVPAKPVTKPVTKPATAPAEDSAWDTFDREVEAMSSDEFRKRINSDKTFRDKYNAPRKN
jgi:hypothetical protein